jgi:hypothetical protein
MTNVGIIFIILLSPLPWLIGLFVVLPGLYWLACRLLWLAHEGWAFVRRYILLELGRL